MRWLPRASTAGLQPPGCERRKEIQLQRRSCSRHGQTIEWDVTAKSHLLHCAKTLTGTPSPNSRASLKPAARLPFLSTGVQDEALPKISAGRADTLCCKILRAKGQEAVHSSRTHRKRPMDVLSNCAWRYPCISRDPDRRPRICLGPQLPDRIAYRRVEHMYARVVRPAAPVSAH